MDDVLTLLDKIKISTKKKTMNIVDIDTTLPALTKVDTLIFKAMCEVSLDKNDDFLGIDEISQVIDELDLSDDELSETIDILVDTWYIRGERTIDGSLDYFQITTYGFERYADVFLPEFERIKERVLLATMNDNIRDNGSITTHLGLTDMLVNYALDILASRNFLKLTKTIGGTVYVDEVTAQGRRLARGLQE